jgi:D-alanyl-D-alanine carboxypeptidase
MKHTHWTYWAGLGVLALLTGTALWYTWDTRTDLVAQSAAHETAQAELTQKVADIEAILVALQSESTTLSDTLRDAASKSDTLEAAFARVNSNVETLEKLTTTDEELLQKYSKVYFLNEHYVPVDLVTIPSEYTYNKARTYEIHEQVWPYLEDLLDTAHKDGIDLTVISAFRSFGEQAQLKGAYSVTYGAGTANQFSADQGYSEHQLGTTVDFTTASVGATFSGFAKTETYAWLLDNAHRFGFILSYPDGNGYYQFEPWHWRFVGTKLARDLHRKEMNFYDMPQREINEYIVDLFE